MHAVRYFLLLLKKLGPSNKLELLSTSLLCCMFTTLFFAVAVGI